MTPFPQRLFGHVNEPKNAKRERSSKFLLHHCSGVSAKSCFWCRVEYCQGNITFNWGVSRENKSDIVGIEI